MGSTGRPPGWYPDPSDEPRNFRWWDGEGWTQALADSLWAPEPQNPQPYVPSARPPQSSPVQTGPRVVEVEDLEQPSRAKIIGVVAVIVLATLAITGAVIWLSIGRQSDADTPPSTASDQKPAADPADDRPSSPTPSDRADDDTEKPRATEDSDKPDPDDSEDSSPPPTSGEDPNLDGHLTFSPPDATWQRTGELLREKLPHQIGAVTDTEESFDGERNWQANIVAGDLPESVSTSGTLQDVAKRTALWFLDSEWNSDPTYGPTDGREVMVDGYPAYRVRTRVSYRLDGLEATYDNIDVVVIDYGPDRAHGLVLASIPNTHPQLWADVDEALGSAHLTDNG